MYRLGVLLLLPMNERFTKEEIEQAVKVLQRLPRGFMPLEIFRAIAEKTVMPAVELAIFRQNAEGDSELLLTQRPADDPHWPNGWHLPGGILLATDEEGSFASIFTRTLEKELHGEVRLLSSPRFGTGRFQETNRGREMTHIYFAEAEYSQQPLTEGKFFAVEALPEGLLQHYWHTIPPVIDAFHSSLQ